ncbi:MAG: COG1361 S-layer family protein, partial [Nitrosopumilaceae archaeon]
MMKMIRTNLFILITAIFVGQSFFIGAYAQTSSDSPFERQFADVKFLDAYFGTKSEKIEVDPGDTNVPFTIVMANVGTVDITGIRGQLSLPLGFTASDGKGSLILADNDDNSLAGKIFTLTFFVNIDKNTGIQQYPGTVKVDYSRLRESGQRNAYFDFNFKVTGESIFNLKAVDPFLTSIKNNNVVVEISNSGTAPLSNVDIVLQNTQTSVAATAQSVTNVENVIFDRNHWDVATIEPKSTKYFTFNVYVPENLKEEALHAPLQITYFNAHGDRKTVTRTIDFYVNGLVDASIYNIDVINLSGKQTVIGEVFNEGNSNGMFAFVTLEPLGDSN